MIVEYVRYTVSDNARADALEAAYARARAALDSSPHCLGYELARGHEEPLNYILRIHWTSLEGHMQGFRKSEEFRGFLAEIRPFISDIQEMKHYTRTEVFSS